jgi:peptidoglycan hydrolase CwlO-like protein
VSLKDYGKAAIERSVDALVADGSVTQKEFGKTKLYWWKQEDAPEGEGMQKLDETIKTMKEELVGVQDEVKKLNNESKSLESSLTNEQVTERTEKLRQEVRNLSFLPFLLISLSFHLL